VETAGGGRSDSVKARILVFDGVDEIDAIGPFRVLQGAAGSGADLDVALVTVDGGDEVVGQHGLRMRVDGRLDERPDLLVVPGGGWAARSPRGAWGEAARGVVPAAISGAHRSGVTVATVCTGAMLAAAAGIVAGRAVATHRAALAELREAGAEVIEARVVDDGDLVSSGGVTSGLDLALWLIERFWGPGMAAGVECGLEYERRGTVWRRAGERGVRGERLGRDGAAGRARG
jgi:transcriptional regulator GlxA family with amidase domain